MLLATRPWSCVQLTCARRANVKYAAKHGQAWIRTARHFTAKHVTAHVASYVIYDMEICVDTVCHVSCIVHHVSCIIHHGSFTLVPLQIPRYYYIPGHTMEYYLVPFPTYPYISQCTACVRLALPLQIRTYTDTYTYIPLQTPTYPLMSVSCPVLSCPVLSCPVLPCPVLSCPVLSCRAGPDRARPDRAVPCRAVPCRAVPCRAVPCQLTCHMS